MSDPFFTVVVPVWNREQMIVHCLNSALSQNFEDFELLAVDDGSTDRTVSVIEACKDRRLRILRQPENRGVCAARDLGTVESRGRWIVYLDSDWVLLPKALDVLSQMATSAPSAVGVIGGRVITDKDEIWPVNPLPAKPFGFVEHLRWMNRPGPTDFQSCHRREVYEKLAWPTDRRLEWQFHLRLAQSWKQWVSSEVISRVYTTSDNRITHNRSVDASRRMIAMSPFLLMDVEEILQVFGDDLRTHARRIYWDYQVRRVRYSLLSRHWTKGTRNAFAVLVRHPSSLRSLLGAVRELSRSLRAMRSSS